MAAVIAEDVRKFVETPRAVRGSGKFSARKAVEQFEQWAKIQKQVPGIVVRFQRNKSRRRGARFKRPRAAYEDMSEGAARPNELINAAGVCARDLEHRELDAVRGCVEPIPIAVITGLRAEPNCVLPAIKDSGQ